MEACPSAEMQPQMTGTWNLSCFRLVSFFVESPLTCISTELAENKQIRRGRQTIMRRRFWFCSPGLYAPGFMYCCIGIKCWKSGDRCVPNFWWAAILVIYFCHFRWSVLKFYGLGQAQKHETAVNFSSCGGVLVYNLNLDHLILLYHRICYL